MIAWDKTAAVAQTEFWNLVRSKAFLVAVMLLPLVMIGLTVLQKQVVQRVDRTPRRFVVVDERAQFTGAIVAAAQLHNAQPDDKQPRFEPELLAARPSEALRVQLSDRVRAGELFAFVEIPGEPDREPLHYHSDHPAYDELREWLARTVDDELRARRYRQARLSPELVEELSRKVTSEPLGLYQRAPDGTVAAAEKQDALHAVVLPLVPAFLLFFFVVISTPQLLHSVMTEKLSRISEVLLGSVSPFELMAGKLLGSTAVSLLMGAVYLTVGRGTAEGLKMAAALPAHVLGWFFVFLFLAMLLYGALCLAVGAACTDVKDAQNLMLPVMLPLTVPMLLAGAVVESPSSWLAVGLSLFPPSTPIIMMLRVGLHPAPPLWQLLLAVALTSATTVAAVWAAGRIFRVGLLSQGKSASFAQMARWIFSK